VLENVSFETLIPKTSHILACMQCNGIWFAGGKFGVTWQLVQAMIRKPVRIQGGCFLRPKSSDLKQLDSIAQKEAEHNSDVDDDDEIHSQDDIEEHQPKKEQPVIVEDSDDEPEKEAEPEPEPEPEPSPSPSPLPTASRRRRLQENIISPPQSVASQQQPRATRREIRELL